MAYEVIMPYHLHMPSYFLETFTEYPCFVYYSQGRDRWFGQVNPAPAADDWIGRFSFDILPMTDNTKLTASVIFAVFYR